MNHAAERNLALLAAEDGELQEADEGLSALIERGDRERAQALAAGDAGAAGDAAVETSRSLLARAQVRAWALRHAEALADLDRAAPLIDGTKPINRQSLRLQMLDTRSRLLSAPCSPVRDMAQARAALDALKREAVGLPDADWMGDGLALSLARAEGDWANVAALAGRIVPVMTARGLPRGVQSLNALAARAWLELGEPAHALAPARAAHEFFATEGPPDIAASAALALARAQGGEAAWPLAESALATVERLTRAQRSVFDQQRYLVEKTQLFDDALRFALALVDAATDDGARERAVLRAWQVAERGKSFSLRQAMTQGGWLRDIDATLAQRLEALDRQLEEAEAQAEYSPEVLERQARLADERQQLLQDAMRRSPALAATQAPPALDLAALLCELGEGEGVVSWYWLREAGPDPWRLHIFHAGADRRARHASSLWRDDDAQSLVRSRREQTDPARLNYLAPALPAPYADRVLPAAVLAALEGCHTLLLTPHRHLQQLPLHAMQLTRAGGGEDRLVERFAVLTSPTLALPRTAALAGASPPPAKQVLLLGCAQDNFHNPPLPDVPRELAALHAIWHEAGAQAPAHEMAAADRLDAHVPLARWGGFDIIHLACHGRFVAGSPLDATLFLGSEALRASEFFALALRAEVVAFSACDVGQHGDALDGLALAGDEWLGLAMPLFQAGARHLLASLWQAESSTARSFMEDFHRALAQGLTPARAHREACLAHLAQPYGWWANWQLVGLPDA